VLSKHGVPLAAHRDDLSKKSWSAFWVCSFSKSRPAFEIQKKKHNDSPFPLS
jgi:hypothetical protein